MLHAVSNTMMAAVIILLSAAAMHGAGTVQIRLKEKAHVKSGKVLLKDVAAFEGADSALTKKLGALPVADAPEFGEVKTFSRHQIDAIIGRAGDAEPGIRTCGAPIVQIRLQGRRITAGEIIPVLKAFLVERTPWREHEIEFHSLENLEKIEVPTGNFDLKVSERSPVIGKGKMLVSFDAVQDGESRTSFWVAAGVRIKARILKAAKRIPYGRKVAADDVVMAVTEIEDLDKAYILDSGEAVGKVARRSFSSGDSLTHEALMEPFLVKNGDTVHLRLERNGLVVTSLARAEQDGRLGQVIRVRNLEFSGVLNAKVTGRSQVEVP